MFYTYFYFFLYSRQLQIYSIIAYCNVDWGISIVMMGIQLVFIVLSDNLISLHFSKQKKVVSLSSIQLEYCVIANAINELQWLKSLPVELHLIVPISPLMTKVFARNPIIYFSY